LHVQTRLLNRTTRRISLTEAGVRYLEGNHEVLDLLDRSISGNGIDRGGTLRVVATDALPPQTLIHLLDGYRRQSREVKVHVAPGEGLPHLLDDRHDIALFSGSSRAIPGGEMDIVPLSTPAQRRVPCAAPTDLAAHAEPVEPRELPGDICIPTTDRLRQSVWKLVDVNSDAHDVKINPCSTGNSAFHPRLAAIAGMGIAVLPDPLVADDISPMAD
jgi:DNA-binding transcriptional LysR family regulator